ncbi:VOC family protein [Henriciella algicola]|uniref:VOC family protein n=1 Tax=Henriciella algicola TaxID=1608422 RepID=A0A399RA28_9PROT|nr:VOC family protein [Henriciella algicola]RIJ27484.1 VOC family protein [Henriciella algicola]
MAYTSKVRTCLWFDGRGEEAAEFYTTLLPDSHIESRSYPEPGKPALVVEFTLAGAPYMVLNGGPMFEHSPAASISVLADDQTEIDRLWDALTKDGGKESMCGWVVDRFGVSWQVVPSVLPTMMESDDKAAAGRARAAMMKMRKFDISALEAAFSG